MISVIVAADQNNAIGLNNALPWRLSADLKYFKQLTGGHAVIMGRKTFDSIGKALPNRFNVVISRSADLQIDGVSVVNSLTAAVELCRKHFYEQIFIIGGDSIYRQSLQLAERVYLTRVHTQLAEADAYFPALNENWHLVSTETRAKDEKNEYDFSFEVYDKQQN